MTMPHLENCPHKGDGWCLDCVKRLQVECDALAMRCVELESARCKRELERFPLFEQPKARQTELFGERNG